MTTHYLAPFSGRLPALERNILKYRAVQIILVIFYCKHLKRKIKSIAENHRRSRNRQKTHVKPVQTGLRRQLSQRQSMVVLQEQHLINETETSEIRSLVHFRNTIAHEVHTVVSDIVSNSLAVNAWPRAFRCVLDRSGLRIVGPRVEVGDGFQRRPVAGQPSSARRQDGKRTQGSTGRSRPRVLALPIRSIRRQADFSAQSVRDKVHTVTCGERCFSAQK